MDLRQLRYFLGIVEHGSIARAADELHVAQSAISLHLNRLEKELGCSLVHRPPGASCRQRAGRLASRARSVLTDIGTIAEEVRGIKAEPSGSVIVGMPTSLGIALRVPLAITIPRQYPLIRLRIAEGLSCHMSQWLLAGQLDLALVFGSNIISGISKELLAREHLNLVGAEGAEAVSSCSEMPVSALFDLPLILPGRPHGLREEVERGSIPARPQAQCGHGNRFFGEHKIVGR
ncbi:LysR family transcriptional regulator [Bradyrhizobium sp. STM 3561]|uniref:LysR family transcriptional regulator n=1 Tax=Bradyrhizobium sp. STM 3561 TaxID=578923 RepID=UPI003890A6CA